MVFPGCASGIELACQCRDTGDSGSIPGSGRSPGGGYGHPLQDSCLGNPMDRGAWQDTAHRVAKSQMWLKWLSMYVCKPFINIFKCLFLRASLVFQTVKNPPANAGDLGLIPGLGRSPGEGNGNPLQDSCLGNPMDGGVWLAAGQNVAKKREKKKMLQSWTPLSRESTSWF